MKIKETVLICEKNKGFLTALTLLVEKEFEEVITESDHDKILSLIKEKEIGIIIMDTGANTPYEQQLYLNLIKEISSYKEEIQIIVFTNFSQNFFGMEAVNSGAFDFIPKPWNNEKLTVTLRNAYRIRKSSIALKNKMENEVSTLEEMEKNMMRSALEKFGGNVTMAAKELGITRQTLYNKGRKYNLFN